MLIAVAGGEKKVPDTFEESSRLYIVDTEGRRTLAVYKPKEDDKLFFAKKTVLHGCEAIASGEYTDKEIFNYITESFVTRYNAAGMDILEAAVAADRSTIPIITRMEGVESCEVKG